MIRVAPWSPAPVGVGISDTTVDVGVGSGDPGVGSGDCMVAVRIGVGSGDTTVGVGGSIVAVGKSPQPDSTSNTIAASRTIEITICFFMLCLLYVFVAVSLDVA